MQPAGEELVRRFQAGEARAFEDLVARWSADLLSLAYRLTGDLEEARDVRQMALIRIHDGLDRFDGRSRVTTWIYRIVLNLCRDRRRRRAAFETAVNGKALNGVPQAHEETPERQSLRKEVALRVAAAVGDLPLEEREVVVLRHYHELSFPRIAEVVGAPVTTVKSRMSRGLDHLRRHLKDLNP